MRAASMPRQLLLAWLHLQVLWTFAIAQPLFAVLADEPAFFVARGNSRGDIVALALGLAFAVPALLAALEAAVARLPRLRAAMHLAFLGALGAAFVLQLIADSSQPAALLLALSAAAGLATALAYAATRLVPAVLTVLSPVPFVLVGAFLLFSPVTKLLFPDEVEAVAAANAADRPAAPVVLVIFDEFPVSALLDRAERIDASRHPGFAALAREATWYPNAATVAGSTVRAVPAILDGRVPGPDTLPTVADHPRNLFTLLGDRYAMEVDEPVTALCPEELCGDRTRGGSAPSRLRSLAEDLGVVSLHQLLPERLRSDLPAIDRSFANFRGAGLDAAGGTAVDIPADAFAERAGAWDAFVARMRPAGSRPVLHAAHVAFPHVPWQFLPSGQRSAASGDIAPGLQDETWTRDPAPVAHAQQRFALQVGYTDRMIARLIARLRATGLWDRALVVVTADHGVSFHAGAKRRRIAAAHPSDIANVPLFVKRPGQRRGRVDGAPVRTIDVLPSMAEALGLRPGWRLDGKSFLRTSPRPTDATGGFERVTFTAADLRRSRAAAVRRQAALLGAGDGWRRAYAIGGDAGLLGDRLPAPPGGTRPGVAVQLDQASLLGEVDPRAALVPSYLSGEITGAGAVRRVAIAVNGTIAGVTPGWAQDGAVRFAGAVPVDALRPGANTVTVAAVDGPATARRVTPLGSVAGETYRLVRRDGRTVIESPARPPIVVADGAARGTLDAVDRGTGTIRGWAIDPGARRPADRVLVFSGERLVVGGPTGGARPDLVRVLGPSAARAGFRLSVADEGALGSDDLRIFAVAGDRATELVRGG